MGNSRHLGNTPIQFYIGNLHALMYVRITISCSAINLLGNMTIFLSKADLLKVFLSYSIPFKFIARTAF